MQLHPVSIAAAHFGNLLTLSHRLAFLDQHRLIVCIGGEVSVVVLEDDQVAVTAQAGTGIHDAASGCSHNGVASLPPNVNSLGVAPIKPSDRRPVGRPDEAN